MLVALHRLNRKSENSLFARLQTEPQKRGSRPTSKNYIASLCIAVFVCVLSQISLAEARTAERASSHNFVPVEETIEPATDDHSAEDLEPLAQTSACTNEGEIGCNIWEADRRIQYGFSKQDDSTKTINTIVTDGEGGLQVQLGNVKGLPSSTIEAIKVHEEEHITQFYRYADATSLALIENETKQGIPVAPLYFSDWLRAEIDAYAVEIEHYDHQLAQKPSRPLRKNIEANRTQSIGFRKMLVRALENHAEPSLLVEDK